MLRQKSAVSHEKMYLPTIAGIATALTDPDKYNTIH